MSIVEPHTFRQHLARNFMLDMILAASAFSAQRTTSASPHLVNKVCAMDKLHQHACDYMNLTVSWCTKAVAHHVRPRCVEHIAGCGLLAVCKEKKLFAAGC